MPKSKSSQIALVGQEEVFAFEDEEVVLTVRLAKEADRCEVLFDDDDVVELDNGRDECVEDFENTGSDVCVENMRKEVTACNVKIEKMHEDLEGTWTVKVDGREQAEFELKLAELPDKILVYSDDKSIEGGDSVETDGDDGYVIECAAEGGTEPNFALFAGSQRVVGAKKKSCKKDDQ